MPVGTLGAVKGIAAADAGRPRRVDPPRQPLPPRPAAGRRRRRAGGRLHAFTGWRRPAPHRQRRLPGVQPRRAAHRRRRRGHLPQPRRRLRRALHARRGWWRCRRGWGSTWRWSLDECPPWPVTPDGGGRGVVAAHPGLGASGRAGGRRAGPRRRLAGRPLRHRPGERLPRAARARRRRAGRARASTATPSAGSASASRRRRAARWWSGRRRCLPADRPRYLMGVGYPEDLRHAVAWGVDLFDCVLPARNARHGVLFTRAGALRIKNARYRDDPRPVDADCRCPACAPGEPRLPPPPGCAPARSPAESSPPSTTSATTLTLWPISGRLSALDRRRSPTPDPRTAV